MAKEFEKKEKMSHLNEADRKAFEEQQRQQAELHNKHEPVHYPGNKAQLEEVWEKQDHMDPEDFNPKTFFMIHGRTVVFCFPITGLYKLFGGQIWTATATGTRTR